MKRMKGVTPPPWIIRADDELVALEQAEDGVLHTRRIQVDTEKRAVSCGDPVVVGSEGLARDTRVVAVQEVEDVELAIPIAVVVFLSGAEKSQATSPNRRPPKRLRLDTSSTPATQLSICALQRKHSGGWDLVPYGSQSLPGPLSADWEVFVTDGPHVVAFDAATRTLALVGMVQAALDCNDPTGVRLVCSHRISGSDSAIQVVSCQYVDDTVCQMPHILVHYTSSTQKEASSGALCGQQSLQHHWSLLGMDGGDDHILPCNYLPQSFQHFGSRDQLFLPEQITSCCFYVVDAGTSSGFNPFGASHFTAMQWQLSRSLASGFSGHSLEKTSLHASVVTLVGTSTNTLYVFSNDVLLATYVLTAPPIDIQIMRDVCHGSHLQVTVQCGGPDRPFCMLSIDMTARLNAVVTLQQFLFVGSIIGIPTGAIITHSSATDDHTLLLNHVPQTEATNISLGRLFLKSVLLTAKHGNQSNRNRAGTSCHRLKFRDDAIGSDNSKARRRRKDASFQCIERIKGTHIREQDGDTLLENRLLQSDSIRASTHQLSMLISSLEQRRAVELERLNRLRVVALDKRAMLWRLNNLLAHRAGRPDNVWSVVSLSSLSPPSMTLKAVLPDQDNNGAIPCTTDQIIQLQPVVTLVNQDAQVDHRGTDTGAHTDEHMTTEFEHSTIPNHRSFSRLLTVNCEEYNPASGVLVFTVGVEFGSEWPELNVSGDFRLGDGIFSTVSLVSEMKSITSTHTLRAYSGVIHCRDSVVTFRYELELPPRSYAVRSGTIFDASVWVHGLLGKSRLMGSIFIDAADLMVANGAQNHPKTEHISSQLSTSTVKTELLLLSGGSRLSTLSKNAPRDVARLFSLQRPLFSVIHVPLPRKIDCRVHDDAIGRMLQALPADVFAIWNPLTMRSIAPLRELIRAMKQELDWMQTLESTNESKNGVQTLSPLDPAGPDQEEPSSSDAFSKTSAMRSLGAADIQAFQLLAQLQQRIKFHSMWYRSYPTQHENH